MLNLEDPVFFPSQFALYWEMDCTDFSRQSLLLGEIVFSVVGGRYTGPLNQNKQLLYKGRVPGCPNEALPHAYVTESEN